MDAERRFVMVCVVRLHRSDHTEIVHTARHVGKQCADFRTALSMSGKIPLGPLGEHFEVAFAALKFIYRHRFASIRKQSGFVVPRIDVRHTAAHIEKDDPLGLWREMGRARRQRIDR